MLHLGLYLAHTLLEAPLPPPIRHWIKVDKTVIDLARQSCLHLLSRDYLSFAPFEEPKYHLKMREHWYDRVHYALSMLMPSVKDTEWMALPHSLFFFYFLLRPIRLSVEQVLRFSK
jgi:hypothetical protein